MQPIAPVSIVTCVTNRLLMLLEESEGRDAANGPIGGQTTSVAPSSDE
jgi:hypothetical protein